MNVLNAADVRSFQNSQDSTIPTRGDNHDASANKQQPMRGTLVGRGGGSPDLRPSRLG
jgi:hypothetical protein